jgi:hypothetical protein
MGFRTGWRSFNVGRRVRNFSSFSAHYVAPARWHGFDVVVLHLWRQSFNRFRVRWILLPSAGRQSWGTNDLGFHLAALVFNGRNNHYTIGAAIRAVEEASAHCARLLPPLRLRSPCHARPLPGMRNNRVPKINHFKLRQFPLVRSLVERQRNNLGRDGRPAQIDVHGLTVPGIRGVHESHGDAALERGRKCAASYLAD